MVPIGPPKEVVPSVDSYALQVFLPVQPPVIIHFTKMPEPRDGLQLSQLLAIRRAYRERLFRRAYLMLDSVVPSSSLMHEAGMIGPGDANVPIASVQSTSASGTPRCTARA